MAIWRYVSYNGNMIVAKFGGSSLAQAEDFARVAKIVEDNEIPVVIVSAPGVKKSSLVVDREWDGIQKPIGQIKVTDLLISAYGDWEKSGEVDGESFSEVCRRFKTIAAKFDINIDRSIADIKAAINSGRGYDYAVSRGEVLSAHILSEILGYNFVDAKECVKLTLDGRIDFNSTAAHSVKIKTPCVIPGFYGKMPNGEIKLLPRGGSDISGAAIAAAMGGEYQKWTDVDGIFDGHGGVIDHLSYEEAELLCYFGATVMQYEAIPLLKNAKIKLTVKNTFAPTRGTVVGDQAYNGYAFSSKKMFLGGNEAFLNKDHIVSEGLKVPFVASMLKENKILIDDCGFSSLALKRVLRYGGIKRVLATALIGNGSKGIWQNKDLLFCGKCGRLFVDEIQ